MPNLVWNTLLLLSLHGMTWYPIVHFQLALFQTPLQENIKYYLFYSFKGSRNFFTNGDNDGKVSLVSQLRTEAQESAIKTFGFNEDHGSILTSSDVVEKMKTLLITFANGE